MSVHFSRNLSQVYEIDFSDYLEDDVFERDSTLTSAKPKVHMKEKLTRDEKFKRLHLYKIFSKYDKTKNGYLEKREIRQLIEKSEAPDLPKELVKVFMSFDETELDGQIDFEDFVKMSRSRSRSQSVREWCVSYCENIVPKRNDDEVDSESLYASRYSMETNYSLKAGEYENQMRFCPPPMTMIIFSLLEISIFVINLKILSPNAETDAKEGHQFDTNNNSIVYLTLKYQSKKREQVWRFFSYMFLHGDLFHIMFNVIFQLGLGIPLEMVHCWWRVCLVYLAGVLAGSIGHSCFKPCTNVVGASAGVYAIITSHVATLILNWHEMKYGAVQLFVFLIVCSCNIFTDVFQESSNDVSNTGHLFGAIAGVLVGIGVLRNLRVRPYQKMIWLVAVAVYISLIVVGICYNVYFVYTYNFTEFYDANCRKN